MKNRVIPAIISTPHNSEMFIFDNYCRVRIIRSGNNVKLLLIIKYLSQGTDIAF